MGIGLAPSHTVLVHPPSKWGGNVWPQTTYSTLRCLFSLCYEPARDIVLRLCNLLFSSHLSKSLITENKISKPDRLKSSSSNMSQLSQYQSVFRITKPNGTTTNTQSPLTKPNAQAVACLACRRRKWVSFRSPSSTIIRSLSSQAKM